MVGSFDIIFIIFINLLKVVNTKNIETWWEYTSVYNYYNSYKYRSWYFQHVIAPSSDQFLKHHSAA